MKNYLFLILSALFLSNVVQAGQTPQFGDIVKNSDGSIRYMSQYLATEYCSSQGMRLPSAREFAQLSQSLGAKGIKEFNEFPNESAAKKAGYYPVLATRWNEHDGFYFSNQGYNRPTGELGNNRFFSYSHNPYMSSPNSYIFFGDSGYVWEDSPTVFSAVMCVLAR
jgi:hypothetical protein